MDGLVQVLFLHPASASIYRGSCSLSIFALTIWYSDAKLFIEVRGFGRMVLSKCCLLASSQCFHIQRLCFSIFALIPV